jgi:dihydropteroate synthase
VTGSGAEQPRYLFVTGRLAEFALRKTLDELAPRSGFLAEIAVLPISVAALMTPRWVARHLSVSDHINRVILPGHCKGDIEPIQAKAPGVPIDVGPEDLRDLPRFFGRSDDRRAGYGGYAIEILAEINHAPRLGVDEIIRIAGRFQAEGADVIDLGCIPGESWLEVGAAVSSLRDRGMRVSIDSFDADEVARATAAGAELVLSVNGGNRQHALDWNAEVVAIPDQPGTLEGLDATTDFLARNNIRFRIDPILEPIGFGFAASLGRYLETRRRYPGAQIMMGIGNLTELTDVDSAGVNTILAGFCAELQIHSVLTTAVINWARSSVRELDLARRLVHHAVTQRTLPKHLEPRLVALRDPRVVEFGLENLVELQRGIRDPNWRIFAENGMIHAINGSHFLQDADPFVLFEKMGVTEPSHSFYLGYELMKAKTALTLGKAYRQDQALEWGFLTEPEVSHRSQRHRPINSSDPGARDPAAALPASPNPDEEPA